MVLVRKEEEKSILTINYGYSFYEYFKILYSINSNIIEIVGTILGYFIFLIFGIILVWSFIWYFMIFGLLILYGVYIFRDLIPFIIKDIKRRGLRIEKPQVLRSIIIDKEFNTIGNRQKMWKIEDFDIIEAHMKIYSVRREVILKLRKNTMEELLVVKTPLYQWIIQTLEIIANETGLEPQFRINMETRYKKENHLIEWKNKDQALKIINNKQDTLVKILDHNSVIVSFLSFMILLIGILAIEVGFIILLWLLIIFI